MQKNEWKAKKVKISQYVDMTTIEGYKNSYFESDKSYLNIDITRIEDYFNFSAYGSIYF